MWVTILSLVLGAIPGVIKGLAQAKVDLANAETEKEKVEAKERIEALQAQRDVLIREANTPWNSIARFTLLFPFAFYLWWIVLYDKIMCKWFTLAENVDQVCKTDPLSDWLSAIAMTIIGFYFVADISKIWKR